jgi:hypothetical protein
MSNPDKASQLLAMIRETRDKELPCDECLTRLAALVEARLQEIPLNEVLQEAAHHLNGCGDCNEEYEALKAAVDALME